MKTIVNPSVYRERRNALVEAIRQEYPDKGGTVCLFAGFEQEHFPFIQESNFFYYTGIIEPGVVLLIDLDGKTTLYLPQFAQNRAVWVTTQPEYKQLGIDKVEFLGNAMHGYTAKPFFEQAEYAKLLQHFAALVQERKVLFTLAPKRAMHYSQQLFLLERAGSFVPGLQDSIHDISRLTARMRQVKSKDELGLLYQAIDVTCMAHEAAVQTIAPDVSEAEVHAAIEYVFIAAQTKPAFTTIVGGGKNGTVLHYTDNKDLLRTGDLVVVDIGAMYEHYCGDLTRTYPVGGKFSARQKEIYNLVLATQKYIESIAKPGMWLSNKEKPDQSLHHLAQKFLNEKGGYDKYFMHGLGHFLGLDVHDVGDYNEPLKSGNVITIEPGIYIAEENIGVRIEDNYWIVDDGIVCLSEQLPKEVDEIEELMAKKR